MATIGSLIVKIGTDIGGLEAGPNAAQSRVRALGGELRIRAGRKRRVALVAVMQANVWFELLRAALVPRRRES